MKREYKIQPFEKEYEIKIPNDKNIVIRLDGHKFSKLTKKYMNKPFDIKFHQVMQKISSELLLKFGASFAYTQSDEITLIIPKNTTEGYTHPYNGRVQKLSSLTAALASAIFNKEYEFEQYILFDSRVFSVSDEMLVDVIVERKKDGIRNSKSMFARHYASHSELLKKSSQEQIDYVKEKYNKDWNSIPSEFKVGSYVKKKKVIVNNAERTKVFVKPLSELVTFELITEKYLKE